MWHKTNHSFSRKISQKDYELDEGQEAGRVWINDTQYFDKVPRIAWEFYIGGYQPAQKWLYKEPLVERRPAIFTICSEEGVDSRALKVGSGGV